MPLDVDTTLMDAVKSALATRATLVDAVKTFRWLSNYSATVQNSLAGVPADCPYVMGGPSGGAMQRQPATFGDMLGPSELIAGVPGRREITIDIVFDTVIETDQTPLEAEIEAALHSLGPKLGIRWVGGVTYRKTRSNQRNAKTGNQLRAVATFAITVDVRPSNADLSA